VYSTAKFSRAHAAALFLAATLFVPRAIHADPAAGPPVIDHDLSSIQIDNFARVNAQYYRGAEPDDDQYARLAALGIKTIVDLRGDDTDVGDQRLAEGSGMKYTHMPMTTHQAPTVEMIRTFLGIVGDPANQPVYVHCVGGRHRTGVMTAVYRMTHDGWTAEQAFKEMKQYKFGADFLHPEFKRFVYSSQPRTTSVQNAGG
jgi:protein tyrosine/serine phosphatase